MINAWCKCTIGPSDKCPWRDALDSAPCDCECHNATPPARYLDLRGVVAAVVPMLRYHARGECRRHGSPLHDLDDCWRAFWSLTEELQEALDAPRTPPAVAGPKEGGQ